MAAFRLRSKSTNAAPARARDAARRGDQRRAAAEGEDAKRLLGQQEFVAILAQLARPQIQKVVTEPDDLLSWRRRR
jgi:hypothetical protein